MRKQLPFGNSHGVGLAAENMQLRADLVAMTTDRDAWREQAQRAQAASTVSASARRLRLLRRTTPLQGQGGLLDR